MKKNFIKILLLSSIFISISTFKANALPIEYLAGKNRYETAGLIADKINYNTAILVNATSLVDGLSASGLSGSVNAPILLTDTNKIPDITLDKIKNSNTIYLVGGEGVISKSIENQIKKLGKEVIRLGGKDRYTTSYIVANEIEKIKGISEVYYVNGLTGQADAMSIAPVAAKNSNPVILTNGKSTDFKRNVKSYSIGGIGVLNSTFDSFCERLGGKDRFETNSIIINRFFSNKDHIYLSKSDELIDALTSSALKQPVVLVNNTSNKSVISSSKSITVLGDIKQNIVNRAKSYVYSDKVVFYSQHQDDETLFAGSTIVDAIKSVGQENVFIVLITDGDESGVFLDPRYKDLSTEEKARLRNNEFIAATTKLGILKENIIFLNQPEGHVDEETLGNLMLKFENQYESVTHIAHTYKYDVHPQHLKTGALLYNLYNKGLIKDCRFFGKKELMPTTNEKLLIESVADNKEERQKVIDACNEYKLDNKDMVREGIGYKSVKSLFDNLTSDPLTTSYLHEPGL